MGKWPLGNARHGVQRAQKIGQRNVCGRNAMVVLIAQLVCGVCVAAKAVMSLFPTRKCWFEGDVFCCVSSSFLIKELLTLFMATVLLAANNFFGKVLILYYQ